MRAENKIVQFPKVSQAASKVIYFPNCEPDKTFVPIPRQAAIHDKLVEVNVCGTSLEPIGIYEGDLLTCRKNFTLSEITPKTVVIIRVKGELLAKTITFTEKNTVTFNCGRTEKLRNVSFVAIALEVRKTLH